MGRPERAAWAVARCTSVGSVGEGLLLMQAAKEEMVGVLACEVAGELSCGPGADGGQGWMDGRIGWRRQMSVHQTRSS